MSPIEVKIVHQYELEDVAALFSELEQHYPDDELSTNYFLSSQWFINWLRSIEQRPLLLCCYSTAKSVETAHHTASHKLTQNKQQLVGFAFWGRKTQLVGDSYYLNQSGDHLSDQVWIEHNDAICVNKLRDKVIEAMCHKLSKRKRFHRIVVHNALSEHWHYADLTVDITKEDSQFVSLGNNNYLDQLSKNTRAAVKRSNKLLEHTFGPISVRSLQHDMSPSQAIPCIEKLKYLHKERWGSSEFGSGFNNPAFTAFHDNMFEAGKGFDILEVTAGSTLLAYLYIMIQKQDALFYLSALESFDLGNKCKPGLSAHYAAIEYLNAAGYARYDFLAGRARYKEQMSTHHYPVYHVQAERKTWLISFARSIKKTYILLKKKLYLRAEKTSDTSSQGQH
ncbi:GNAT family N-acetyltransferase [Glaciecola sp. MH2013]|uniref:GNAT family N-acetyltransferase n=1 Tax=Glaciecola sp. MH2013 TaxID=2785524 RepID=UPI00189E33CF|nr:GNAT family N-acetyltransferase [Glaciecola sp. MH2013]MBF7072172.1 GNAT family N-acetyltransferase [Glaciecola sp. MH2013]